MTLIKTSLLNGIAVAIKMLTMLGINKILAIYVGPTGYAALGQFQNAVQMITTFGSGAINIGVTKYTAEYFNDGNEQRKVWQTGGSISLIGSIFTGLLVAIFNKPLAIWFLKDPGYGSLFVWFGLTLVFFVFNTLLLAILNGKKEISRYVTANIVGSIFSLVISAAMIMQLGLYGALLTLAINQSLVFFVTLALCYRTTWFKFKYLFGAIDKKVAISLSKYLPRLSELKDPLAIKREIISGYKIILPLSICGGITIYLLRDLIISLLFSENFLPMRNLFAWQMLGDTLKIGSWILAYLMLGQAMVKIFIATEILFGFGFYAWTLALTNHFGTQAAVVAHTLNYLAYWALMIHLTSKTLHRRRE